MINRWTGEFLLNPRCETAVLLRLRHFLLHPRQAPKRGMTTQRPTTRLKKWLGRGMFQKMAHLCLQKKSLLIHVYLCFTIIIILYFNIMWSMFTHLFQYYNVRSMFLLDFSEALQHISTKHGTSLARWIKTTVFYPTKSRCLFLPWAQNKLFCWLFVVVEAKLLLIPADCILFLHTILVPIMTQWLSNGRTPMFFATDGDEREYQPGPRE